MYVVTNRNVIEGETGVRQFGNRVNSCGPNELRFAQVHKRANKWQVKFLEDELTEEQVNALVSEHNLRLPGPGPHYASLKVACDMAAEARKRKRHILLFVHGYNNDMSDVLNTAEYLETQFQVQLIIFSWPANGGGVGGSLSYKSDKRDARASNSALDRVLSKMHEYLALITESNRLRMYHLASTKHGENREALEAYYAELLLKHCPFTVNALFHSMGNYLLKQALKSSLSESAQLVFDNIVLCQADTNNLDHNLWVDQLKVRNRIYITLNENDYALAASRTKAGSEQLARLGHYVRRLDARVAHYINFTGASWVKNSHSPFRFPATKNEKVEAFFKRALMGEEAESILRYRPEGNWYAVD